jgi:ribonuclease HI
MTALPQVEIYTDGACSGNPGPGGWAALLRYGSYEKMISGAEPQTTNNRMEMMGVIAGLESLRKRSRVKVFTDSQYVWRGAKDWLPGWKSRGWLGSARKPIANVDLWKRIDQIMSAHQIEWFWVRGHSGHVENERVDYAAREAIKTLNVSKGDAI